MSNLLTIGTSEIRQLECLFSLNDLHKASGGEEKHRPTFFLRNEQTRSLIAEIEQCANSHTALKTVNGGQNRGTYACKELVIAYASWISPAFHLKVIRVFLAQQGRGLDTTAITKEQQGEIATLMGERFPDGKHRPYAWGRFNNHFRLASYKDLPAARFDEACQYIRTMPLKEVNTQKHFPLGFGNRDKYQALKERAQKYIHDCILHAKNGSKGVWPEMDIPDDVLAGLVAAQLPNVGFYLDIGYDGSVSVQVRQSPYKGLAKAIADPGNIGLQDSVIEEIGQACVTALAHRAKRREAVIHTARG